MHRDDDNNLAKELFESLLDRSAEERAQILSGMESSVRREVEELLVFHTNPDGFLMEPLVPVESAIPQSVGPYEVVEEIGFGGASRVFLARRADDLHTHDLALKVIRRVRWDGASERAFRREVEALSRIEHPYVVRFLDGGLTEDGYLYFAMEYVRGVRITDFGRTKPLEERLRVFQRVCEAVAFAHRHLIIHRDVKPSNILVQADGTPKLLDFGIALLLDQETRETATGLDRMTLRYASPEQVRGDKKLTTATDIYSLGVLLYEMLSGSLPFAADRPHEIMRAILEDDPPRIKGAKVPADLQAVAAKALRKEPDSRYQTADALCSEIESFLRGFPVQAHRSSWSYRAGKFTRRHRKALVFGGLTSLVWLAGGVSLVHQYRLAQRRLEDALDLAGAQFMYLSHEQRTPAQMLESAEFNRKALTRLVRETGSEKATLRLVHLLHYIGTRQGHASLAIRSNSGQAVEALSEAVELAEWLYKKSPEEYTVVLSMVRTNLGSILLDRNEQRRAMEQFERARTIDAIPSRSDDENIRRRIALSQVLVQISRVALSEGNVPEALALRQQVIALCEEAERALPDEIGVKVEVANAHALYGAALRKAERFEETTSEYTKALSLLDAVLRTEDRLDWKRLRIRVLLDLGAARIESGDVESGVNDVREVVAALRELEKATPGSGTRRSLAAALSWLAVGRRKAGSRGADEAAAEALAMIRKEANDDPASLVVQRESNQIAERIESVGLRR